MCPRGCWLQAYRKAREKFFEHHGRRWPGTLEDGFDILEAYPLSHTDLELIREATGALSAIYNKTASLLRNVADDVLLEMGVPPYLLRVLRCSVPGMQDCVLGRFDFAHTQDGYKMLEFNSDSPGLIVEAFSVNAEVCQSAGKQDPNQGCQEALAHALERAVCAGRDFVGKGEDDNVNVVVTFAGGCSRDRAAAAYLSELLRGFGAKFAPAETLSLDSGGLWDTHGKRIDVLYRNISLKFIRNGLFQPHGEPLDPAMGGLLLHHVESRRLAVINPPFAFLQESKAVQAVIWNLFATGEYFDASERRLIGMYMLPVHLDPPSDQRAYVVKPIMGAEGDTITMVDPEERVLESQNTTYSDQPMVYQKYVDLPKERLMTEFGPRTLHLVTSCFVVAGIPSAICIRAGGPITNEEAWVVPVCTDAGL
jgi:glutathionylspermidine synthase